MPETSELLEKLLGWEGNGDGRVEMTELRGQPFVIVWDPQGAWAAEEKEILRFLREYQGMTAAQYHAAHWDAVDGSDHPYHRLCQAVWPVGLTSDGYPDTKLLVAAWKEARVALCVGGDPLLREEALAVLVSKARAARAVADEMSIDLERVQIDLDEWDEPVAYIDGLDEEEDEGPVLVTLDDVDVGVRIERRKEKS